MQRRFLARVKLSKIMEEKEFKNPSAPIRWGLILIAYIFLVLGLIGAFLPVLPTTPFLIVAAYFFSKSSPRLHLWLTSLPYFGNAIIEWERHRIIRPKAKVMAISLIIIMFSYSLFFTELRIELKTFLALLGISVIVFIGSRKSKL